MPHLSLETSEPTRVGSGFASGLVSAVLGLASLGAVLCIRYPNLLTYADLRVYYAMPLLRATLHVALVTSFLLGSVSACLRRNKMLAVVGLSSTLLAALLGGSQVPLEGDVAGRAPFGLDFFVLNLMLYAAVFVPLERLFALRPEQPVFRAGWLGDLVYFFVNSLLIEMLTIATLLPALVLFGWARVPAIVDGIGSLPLAVQVPLVVLVADFTQVLGASGVPRGARALAVPRDPSLGGAHGLARGFAAAPGGRDRDTRVVLCADLRARVLERRALRLRLSRGRASDVHSRQCPMAAAVDPGRGRHAGIPPLASQRGRRGRGQELRGAYADLGSAVRHVSSAGPLAAIVRPVGRASRAVRLAAAAPASVSAALTNRPRR